ncbi:hypothetical protein LEMLEM_LOCUS8511, partial [Lemmus lemmus]
MDVSFCSSLLTEDQQDPVWVPEWLTTRVQYGEDHDGQS